MPHPQDAPAPFDPVNIGETSCREDGRVSLNARTRETASESTFAIDLDLLF
jgi:hypothetical protein